MGIPDRQNSIHSHGSAAEGQATTDGLQAEDQAPSIKDDDESTNYLTGLRLYSLTIGLVLAVICSNLDRSIIGVATPKITSEFNSLDDVAWYGSAYLMMGCCAQLAIGKLYASYDAKWIYLVSIAIFEVGSILCAAAPDSLCLIIGRAVAGLGATGIGTGSLLIIAFSMPVSERPKYTGMIGACTCVSIILAPFLGGLLTDKASWRWCFWINLPMGGITLVMVFLCVRLPKRRQQGNKTLLDVLKEIDFIGILLIVPCIISLLLALQWGGTTYGWGNWRCILLLTLFGVLALAWAYNNMRLGDRATLPMRIVKRRSMVTVMWFAFCTFANLFISTYFVPIWFQAVRSDSAYRAGVNLLSSTVPMMVCFIVSGFLTSSIGYYVPQLILGSILAAVSTGLMVRFDVHTSTTYWAVALALSGASFGLSGQQPMMVAQTIFKGDDIALATSALIFVQALASSIFLFVCENVFSQKLLTELHKHAPTVNPHLVTANGGLGLEAFLSNIYPSAVVQQVLVAYAEALKSVWIIGAVLASISILGAVSTEWINVKKVHQDGKGDDAGGVKLDTIGPAPDKKGGSAEGPKSDNTAAPRLT